jgi:hypothetical protein
MLITFSADNSPNRPNYTQIQGTPAPFSARSLIEMSPASLSRDRGTIVISGYHFTKNMNALGRARLLPSHGLGGKAPAEPWLALPKLDALTIYRNPWLHPQTTHPE